MVSYYAPNNVPDFNRILEVPVKDRLPALAKKIGMSDMGKILMAEVTKFQNCYNVIRPMNSDQIAQCALSIIQTSEEDYLSLEDIVLFFEGAKQGKYGKVYDRLDQQIIFEMFEVYRDQRHQAFMRHQEEQHAQNSAAPVDDRFVSDANQEDENKFRSVMVGYMKKQYQDQEKKTA